MDSTFLLYLYTMIVMGCLAIWASLYYHFIQTGLIVLPPTNIEKDNATKQSALVESGQQQQQSRSPSMTNAETHQQQDEHSKTPDPAGIKENENSPIKETTPTNVGGIASLKTATLSVPNGNGSSVTMNAQETKTPTKNVARSASEIKSALLRWCQSKTKGYAHINITNYTKSWCDGMAFCALIHHFYPDAFDYSKLDPKNRRENFDLAFRIAEQMGDIPALLEVDDMIAMGDNPDYKCLFTYIQQFYRRFHNVP